ncbi:hypothetical protein [Streptomyces halobius]|nr:hypothetical protein [Streptomyces halobius]
METIITILIVSVIVYALGFGKGRSAGQTDNVTRAVADLLSRGR